jgi:outer membrane protein OmpA-like peptidoglycan-associated protein
VLAQPQRANYRIRIEGHTDNTGLDRYDQLLSERRAESVKLYLTRHFPIEANRLSVRRYGQNNPIASNNTPEGKDKNRRVQVLNIGKD